MGGSWLWQVEGERLVIVECSAKRRNVDVNHKRVKSPFVYTLTLHNVFATRAQYQVPDELGSAKRLKRSYAGT